jgi:hypothetical protein
LVIDDVILVGWSLQLFLLSPKPQKLYIINLSLRENHGPEGLGRKTFKEKTQCD